ncbi:MAG: hypothetical protein CBD97_00800 [Pelagibacteraceae bacterium TMED237]|nr:hypothetical protein [Candidatus Neomarinimicrobiota bacterium]OUW96755.1 MAG: hypothetical protein CBD97_00800 [Pelagibacteraceae bacterium TMED237]|tara:strand:+ start:8788 stop:9108 length:321 start_codon:yes stop_codon:yes gene_type:complete
MAKEYKSFKEFYKFYLSEHINPVCRILHFIGTLSVILIFIGSFFNFKLLLLAPFSGYGLAWIGHFFFEKNKPATFKYPLYSFIADWIMFKDILIRKESILKSHKRK